MARTRASHKAAKSGERNMYRGHSLNFFCDSLEL